MIIEFLITAGSAACFFGPSFFQARSEYKALQNQPQEFSSRQVKLVAELLAVREGWSQFEGDPLHESGVRYFPGSHGDNFYSILGDDERWEICDDLTAYDRFELQRLYKALAKEVKNERQSELTRSLARRVVSGERVEAEPTRAQLDVEHVKSLGFNPLAGTKWEGDYASAGISFNHSPGRLMLSAFASTPAADLEERIRTGMYRDEEEYAMYDPDVLAWKSGRQSKAT